MIIAIILISTVAPDLVSNIFVQYGFMGLFMAIMMYYSYYQFQQDKEEIKNLREELKEIRKELNICKIDYLNFVKSISE